ncbi:glyceraldehyde-3-phosphate dehydrogenase [Microbacterium trichothecenolyticum]|uniref:Glyceraldehyde-3-phosphate dehydrogenase n=1 Tax=Microbacterium ureisolvens TaxID=2781186 RepID=A0ABS7HYG0_9MICO|nr:MULTISPECIES: glyceraldehyde-3-phosphate dehydrogenase [Microbacterium]MBW9110427.1 glyceraldehyde-3-phosphate dehydrogenase [Microbacterium ureisolvens]MBW9120532.1 glyceraldehyde-3-phosphate dehydrogenase [Microbacterium trichothecenolyticum]
MAIFAIEPAITFETHRSEWVTREEHAEQLIPLIGRLYRNHGVVTSIHGHRLINLSATGVITVHDRARDRGHAELTLDQTRTVLEALLEIAPQPASIDIARLALSLQQNEARDPAAHLRAELGKVSEITPTAGNTDVVLYGFGRIGRLLARILIDHAGNGHGLRLRAIVVRRGSENDLTKRASLLSRDSVHGPFAGSVTVDAEENVLIANGTRIQVIYADDPAHVDYTAYGITDAIIVDNTGRWRDEDGLSEHLRSPGASRVLLTAPGKTPVKNIVHGINDDTITMDDKILSAASCTTNAITPVLKAVDHAYGVARGHVETVHSFTNDQNLTDNFHRGDRRGRSAVLNMVITETGAAKAVAKALPELAGRLTGSSIRVPTPDVSLAILNLTLERPTTKDEVNDYLRRVSLHSNLRQQVDYVESPEVVSTDFVGSHRAGIVDGLATIAEDRNLILYVWYDNEYGYSSQVIRVLEKMAGTHPVVIPARLDLELTFRALR